MASEVGSHPGFEIAQHRVRPLQPTRGRRTIRLVHYRLVDWLKGSEHEWVSGSSGKVLAIVIQMLPVLFSNAIAAVWLMKLKYWFLAILTLVLLALIVLRVWDHHAEQTEWARLAAMQPDDPGTFDPAMVADLPEPARRFFNTAIKPGTPLLTVAEIDMGGQFSLGPAEDPNYQPMEASQILAAPSGFVWKLRLPGWVPVSGSDSSRWTRFRIFGLIPVARLGGDPDHARAAFGRYIAEALFWTPAALLPGPGIVWEEVDATSSRVTVSHQGLSQAVDVEVDDQGRPKEVRFMRWSDANPMKEYRLQPFGGKLSEFREVQGFRLPFKVEAGNMFGTEDYFEFFNAEVISIRFPTP
jgi:hypothetical protein